MSDELFDCNYDGDEINCIKPELDEECLKELCLCIEARSCSMNGRLIISVEKPPFLIGKYSEPAHIKEMQE
jgi:hypothetical protein